MKEKRRKRIKKQQKKKEKKEKKERRPQVENPIEPKCVQIFSLPLLCVSVRGGRSEYRAAIATSTHQIECVSVVQRTR